jgi:outer membrane protein assembly factor BamE
MAGSYRDAVPYATPVSSNPTPDFMQRISLSVTAVCLAVSALTGCSIVRAEDDFLGFITPYRVEVVQGNVVTKEMLAQLREGMSRDQVRFALGSPLLTDVFHADRWDYVFSIRRQGAAAQERRVTVYFAQDLVSRFDASTLPSERDFVASIDTAKPSRKQPVLELSDEQLRALPLPAVPAPNTAVLAAAPTGAKRSYPPLEASQP